MKAHRLRARIADDHTVTLEGLPFPPGEEVEIIVLSEARKDRKSRYPLRGLPLEYERPTDPVAESDWEVLS